VLGVAQLVWGGRKRRFRALPGRDSCRASQDDQRGVCLRGQALHGEKGGNAGAGTKAGAVLGRGWPGTPAAWETGRSECKPLAASRNHRRSTADFTDFADWKKLTKLREDAGSQRSDFPISRFQISAFAFLSQLWSEDFTAKLFCNVEFWIERLAKLIGA